MVPLDHRLYHWCLSGYRKTYRWVQVVEFGLQTSVVQPTQTKAKIPYSRSLDR